MQLVLISLVVIAIAVFGLPAFSRANPTQMAKLMRFAGGAGLFAFALLLMARGQFQIALLLLGVGLPLLFGRSGRMFGSKPKSAGQISDVQTAYLRLRLDHDSGAIEGEVLQGRYAGRKLTELALSDLQALLVECRDSDLKSIPLLESYLDQRFPDWRDEPAAAAGGPKSPSGVMTPAEARQILGVGPGADTGQIRAAWRELMKRNHPDQGGSSYLAAKINEAKDVLLGNSDA